MWPEWTVFLLPLFVVFLPVGGVLYLALRFVRALEARKGVDLRIRDLTAEVRALRAHTTLMNDELTELERGSR